MKIIKSQFIRVIFCYFLKDIVLISGHPHSTNEGDKTKKVNKNRDRERESKRVNHLHVPTSHHIFLNICLDF